MRVYLAGPDVFRKDAKRHAESIKALCSAYGLTGVFPLDVELNLPANMPGPTQALNIFNANVGLINSCHGVLANVTPFRGPSADVGTAWEMGFAYALGLPVEAYTTDMQTYAERVAPDEYEVEHFGLEENLMLACSSRISLACEMAVQRLRLALLLERTV
jgi:nucleoside 2-deoxyribosyltransferase